MKDRHGIPLAVGDLVRADRETPARGTWRRYAGRIGRIVVLNHQGEIGVGWEINRLAMGNSSLIDTWFLPSELVRVGQEAPGGPQSGETNPLATPIADTLFRKDPA